MRINSVRLTDIHFGAALNSRQVPEYQKVLQQANTALGTQGGKKVLIVHDASLPQSLNTGVGNLTDPKAQEFITLMQKYMGINTVEVLPQGQYGYGNRFCPYGGSAFSLSQNVIDPQLLATKEFGEIVTPDELKSLKVAFSHDIQYENLTPNSNYDSLLRRAHERFISGSETSSLKQEFEAYKSKSADWLEPKSIFPRIASENGTHNWREWNEIDRNLYNRGLNGEMAEKVAQRLTDLKIKHKKELDFFAFKQFLAENHLARAKKSLNVRGIELIGDCLIGQSSDEVWANQEAFYKNVFTDWNISIDYTKIRNSDDTLGPAGKFLERKFAAFLRRYDGVRMDVGHGFIYPNLHKGNSKGPAYYFNEQRNYMGDSIIRLLENTAKKVKGKDFDLSKIMYETEGMVDKTGAIAPLKGRVQVCTTMWQNSTWGSPSAFMNRGLKKDEFIVGVGNHDSIALRALANGGRAYRDGLPCDPELRLAQYEPLAKNMKTSEKLLRANPIEFAKTKLGEISGARHQMYFSNDILGSDRLFDSHGGLSTDYRIRIPKNFEEVFHGALQEGWGVNPMDTRRRAFISEGLDKTHPKLFQKICDFADYLSKQGAKTQAEADKLLKESPTGKLLPFAAIGVAALTLFGVLSMLKNKKKPTTINRNPVANLSREQQQTFANFLKF